MGAPGKYLPFYFWLFISIAHSLYPSLQYQTTIETGTAPLSVVSTTLVTNLNADMVDGLHASEIGGAQNRYLGAYNYINNSI